MADLKDQDKVCETPPAPLRENTREPCVKSSEPLPKPSAPPAPRQKGSKSALLKALKREDQKYKDINFDVPPPVWSKEEKSKMRDVMRTISINLKKQANRNRIKEIYQQHRTSGPVATGLTREIVGLLQKDINLMNHMELKDVAFSTFSKNTYDWGEVAKLLDTQYTAAECKEYWYMDLYPRIKNMGFTPDNEKQLIELAIENKYQNWDKIADKLIGHTEYQCYMHFRRNLYKKVQQPTKKKGNKST